ncbi:MAG: hypothetical protein R2788_03385 [Saprospiraceae bacterium]
MLLNFSCIARPLFWQLGGTSKNSSFNSSKILEQLGVEKRAVLAAVVFDELRFRQFEEQDAVHPSDAQLQGNGEEGCSLEVTPF